MTRVNIEFQHKGPFETAHGLCCIFTCDICLCSLHACRPYSLGPHAATRHWSRLAPSSSTTSKPASGKPSSARRSATDARATPPFFLVDPIGIQPQRHPSRSSNRNDILDPCGPAGSRLRPGPLRLRKVGGEGARWHYGAPVHGLQEGMHYGVALACQLNSPL